MTKVKNINGTSRFPAHSGYNSWLEYWEKQTGQKATECGAINCKSNEQLFGAHVIKVNSSDKKYYITPLCPKCNKRTDNFNVDTELVPVPSNL
jgi:hypothetical protein